MVEVDIELPLKGFTLAARFASDAGVTALFGRSGAGKTTIVDCIAGLRRPARGRIAVGGETLFDSGRGIDVPRHRRRVGYVFQDARLFPHLTVRRNLLYGRWFRRGAGGPGLGEVVELLGIGHLLARRPVTLSGGERQRVAIARALVARPAIVFADEPTGNLDSQSSEQIMALMHDLHGEGHTIVVITHDRDMAEGLPRQVEIRDGAIVHDSGAA